MKICYILKGDPFSWKAHEALRISLALVMNHQVFLIFLRDGVYTLTDWKPEGLLIDSFDKIFQLYSSFEDNIKIFVDEESLKIRGIKKKDLKVDCQLISDEEIKRIINSCEAVVVW